ncbi:hypothetical protein ES707_17624 [subsurface metagenome]
MVEKMGRGAKTALGLGAVGAVVGTIILATRAEAAPPLCTPGETKCEGFDLYECHLFHPLGEPAFTRWVLAEANSPDCGWEPGEAEFEVSGLVIEPTEVFIGEPVEISVLVTNIGGKTGTKTVTLEVT